MDSTVKSPYIPPVPPVAPVAAAPVRSRLDAAFEWKQPSVDKVSQIENAVLTFCGPDARINGAVARRSVPEITQDHSTLASWFSAVQEGWDKFSLNAGSADGSRHAWLQFFPAEEEIRANLDVAGKDTQPMATLLAELRQTLALPEPKPTSFTPTIAKPKQRIEGRYHVEHPEDPAWFKQALDLLEAWSGKISFYMGSYSLLSVPQFRNSPATYDEWKQQCLANWKDVLDLNASLNGSTRECSVRFYVNRADFSIALASYHTQEIAEYFKTIEKDLPILPARDLVLSDSRKGERRRYFAAETIDNAWFERCIALVRSLPKGTMSFQGKFRVAGHEGEDFSQTNFDGWHQEITSKWNALTWIYCWISTPEVAITLDIDLLRDLISLDLQSPTEDVIASTFTTLEMSLKIAKIKGNPYRYRRFQRTFRFDHWTSNKQYADALQEAVNVAFPGRAPGRRLAITSSYVTVGEAAEDLDPFTDYQQFCQRLEREDFGRAELVLEGPHGRTLGVAVNRKTKRLTVRTSLERADLETLIRPFKNALDLTLEESKDEPEKPAGQPSATRTTLLTIGGSFLVAILAAGATIFTSQKGLAPLHKSYSLEILYPQSDGTKPVSINGKQMRLEWKLAGNDINGPFTKLDSPATVSVLKDGEVQPTPYRGSDGEVVIPITPGSYFVKVVSDVDHQSEASINIVVPEPKPTTPVGKPGRR